MFVRWLGAFSHEGSFHDSLGWELSQQEREVACEHIPFECYSKINQSKVGLLVKKEAVRKVFNGDCFSYTSDLCLPKHPEVSLLIKTRNPRKSAGKHREAFVHPTIIMGESSYRGIVIKEVHINNLPKNIQGAIRWYALRYNLNVYFLNRNGHLTIEKI